MIQVLKQVVQALEEAQTNDDGMEKWDRNKKAITSLCQIIAELESQEPYALEALMYSNDRIKVDPVTGNVSIGTPQRTEQD